MLDDEGRSDFGALQRSLGGRGGKLHLRVQFTSPSTCCIVMAMTCRRWKYRAADICLNSCLLIAMD